MSPKPKVQIDEDGDGDVDVTVEIDTPAPDPCPDCPDAPDHDTIAALVAGMEVLVTPPNVRLTYSHVRETLRGLLT